MTAQQANLAHRVKLAPMAAEVVAMYAAEGPCEVWPELDALQCWDGDAIVVTADNRDAVAGILIDLCNYYDELATGRAPASEGEPRPFCRAASKGLGGAWSKVLGLQFRADQTEPADSGMEKP